MFEEGSSDESINNDSESITAELLGQDSNEIHQPHEKADSSSESSCDEGKIILCKLLSYIKNNNSSLFCYRTS